MLSREGLADFASRSVEDVVDGVDLAILAMPICAMGEIARQFPEAQNTEQIVTDVGSVKGSVVREIDPIVSERGWKFIGSHPMAGSEKKGMDHSDAELFQNAAVILTDEGEGAGAGSGLAKLRAFWEVLGGRVSVMEAHRHDELVGWISHLPHLVAAALSRIVSETHSDAGAFSGGGFRDTTRVAGGPEEMWSGILRDNGAVLSDQLGQFIVELEKWKMALDELDRDQLRGFLSEARRFRESL